MNALIQYKKLIGISENLDSETDFENIKNEFKLKDSLFLNEKYEEEHIFISHFVSLDEILDSMNFDKKTNELIKTGSKKHYLTEYKIAFIKEAIKNNHTLKDIGVFTNTTQSAISNFLAFHNIDMLG